MSRDLIPPQMTESPPLQTSSPDSAAPRSCIHEEFERQAARSPGAVAVSWDKQALSYQQLNTRANQLAHHLRQLGVRPETPVALYLDRTLPMVTAILAVLKAGGAYVPIDLAYPRERLEFILQDTRAPVLLTQENLRAKIPTGAAHVVCLDSDRDQLVGQPEENLGSTATPDNAAYIIYTSGSTGKPKGVMVTHHNVVRLLKQTAPWYQFSASDIWPLFHSYAFDVSVWELWGSLFNGGRLIVVPYLVTRSPAEFYELLAREKVTVLNQTPSAFRQLIWAEESAPTKLQLNLRYVICAGEALELQSLRPWFNRHGDQRPRIVNMYGITETTVHSTYRVIRQADLEQHRGSVIGVPIPDLQLHLVDENLQPVPPGVPGEICVGGAGVARGYLNRPELTPKRFLADPFSNEPGARLYRSGDLAQINAEGEMEYLGRMDHQVKIRGFRVELGEIESALNRHPAIRETCVVAHESGMGDKRLVAYFAPVDTPPTVTELREFLGKSIPEYMVPAVFMPLKAFPLTTNGKVDRRALPAPDGTRPELQAAFVAPRTETEQTLAAIWCEVLEIQRVGVEDNYFELGGDSIRAITLLARAQEAGMPLALVDIFQAPTVAGLAARLKEQHRSGVAATPKLLATQPFSLISTEDRAKLPADVEDAYPLSRLQLGMFYFNELDPLSAVYHDVFSYRVKTPFEPEKFAAALANLAARHPLLRTSFHLAGFSQPLQFVHRDVQPPLTVEDLRPCSGDQQAQHLLDWIETEKRRPFDRSQPPLVRFHVQVQGADSFQLILSFHHSCLDGWSLAAVVTEILQEYTTAIHGQTLAIRPPQVTYRDFIALEQQALASDETRRFWNAKLEGATPQTLPRWPEAMREGGHEQKRGPEVPLSENELKALRELAHASGVPLRTVFLAAHLRVMALLYGQTDVLTGNIGNGRPESLDGERLIGLFLNTVPLRQQLRGGTWAELVRETFANEQELLPHRRFPLAEVQKIAGGQPLFETAFDYVHFHVYKALHGLEGIDLAEGHYFEANNLALYTTFMLDVTSTHLEVHVDYDPNRVCRQQAEEITQYYLETLRAMACNPSARYEEFSPLSERELHRLLLDWNATEETYPRDSSLAELFENAARKSPDSIAVVCGAERLSYRELNAKADQLADHLRARKVQPEELVGLCVERSPNLVVGLLGILKAGAAYVPLDPTYPPERLRFMLEDSQLRLLLTERELQANLPPTSAEVLYLDMPDSAAPRSNATSASGTTPATGSPHAQLAYVIYTSGSTGKPKGVQVTQGSVINLLCSIARKTGFTSQDNLLAVTTLSFDIAGLELFLPLITGARLTLATRQQAGDGTQLARLLADTGATVLQGTPATWRLLLESGWTGSKSLTGFCGGEALKRSLADDLLLRVAALWNFYGPTETTIWSTAWKVLPSEPISIGRPLGNTQVYVLDEVLLPLPVGTVGELHIGGDGVARGYLGQPELTAQKFVSVCLPGQRERRVYKTGDLARFMPDGSLQCLGRVDHQVKVRGFRIELGEIESVLRQHASVAEAVVTAWDDAFGEKRLVAYVLSKNGPPPAAELRDFARTRLPLYMVPAQFVQLEHFPLTPNGKLDMRRLPAPEGRTLDTGPHQPPRTVEEQQIAAIWREVLSASEVGVDENFFELGGDSLSATRAFARINRAFATELTLREMLDHPTVQSLAELVVRVRGSALYPGNPIPRQPRTAIVERAA